MPPAPIFKAYEQDMHLLIILSLQKSKAVDACIGKLILRDCSDKAVSWKPHWVIGNISSACSHHDIADAAAAGLPW